MHELVAVLGRVELHNPVHFGDVNASGCEVRGQQNLVGGGGGGRLELGVGLAAFLLVDFAVQFRELVLVFQHYFIQDQVVEIYTGTGSEEYNEPLRMVELVQKRNKFRQFQTLVLHYQIVVIEVLRYFRYLLLLFDDVSDL